MRTTKLPEKTVCVIFAAMVACSAFADATWEAAVDGDWRTTANWVNSVEPSSSGMTYITPADAAYTVTLGSGVDVTTKGLTVSGLTTPSYQTKLNISDTKLITDGAMSSITYGAVTVGSGAELEFKNAAGATLGTAGKIEVDGGSFVMTNGISAALSVGSTTWVRGGNPTFSVKSGNAYFKGAQYMMRIQDHALFQMTGGRVEMIDTSASHNKSLLYVVGNNPTTTFFSMSGDSELLFSNGGNLYLGYGISEFKGNAKLTFSGGSGKNGFYLSNLVSDSNRKITVNVSDNVSIEATSLEVCEFGKNSLSTTGTTGEFNISGGDIKLGYRATLGAGIGKYNVNMTGGKIDFPQYGVRIGTVPFDTQNVDAANAKDLANTTTVTVAGGTFACTAAQSQYETLRKEMWGFVVGAGLVGRQYAHLMNGWVDGRINLQTGGTITNGCVLKMFGVGRGVGTMTQTGGTYEGDSRQTYYYPFEGNMSINNGRYPDAVVLGAFGGEGIYDLQGGTATLRCPIMVGGASLTILNRTDSNNMLPADTAGQAVGTLKVSGGAMTVGYQSYVGYDGRGTIDVSGDGSLIFQNNLILTNSVADAATLKVTFAGATAPTFRIDGRLTVCAGAKLVVDTSDFRGDGYWTKLIDVRGGRTGSFDPANITVVGYGDIVQTRSGDSTGSIWLHRGKSFRMIIR